MKTTKLKRLTDCLVRIDQQLHAKHPECSLSPRSEIREAAQSLLTEYSLNKGSRASALRTLDGLLYEPSEARRILAIVRS